MLGAFAYFVVVLLVPLFLIPELLLRRGWEEWKTRVIGWALFGGIVIIATSLFIGRPPRLEDLARPDVWLLVAVLLFAAWWDLRRARRKDIVPDPGE